MFLVVLALGGSFFGQQVSLLKTDALSLDAGAPAGAAIDSATGVFSWTPSEADGPVQFDVTVRVTDDGGLSDSETITISVNELVLPTIADMKFEIGQGGYRRANDVL